MVSDSRSVARLSGVPGVSRAYSPAVSEAIDAIQIALADLEKCADPGEYARALAELQVQLAGKLARLL